MTHSGTAVDVSPEPQVGDQQDQAELARDRQAVLHRLVQPLPQLLGGQVAVPAGHGREDQDGAGAQAACDAQPLVEPVGAGRARIRIAKTDVAVDVAHQHLHAGSGDRLLDPEDLVFVLHPRVVELQRGDPALVEPANRLGVVDRSRTGDRPERVAVSDDLHAAIMAYNTATRRRRKYGQSHSAPQPGPSGGAMLPSTGTAGLTSPISLPASSRDPPVKYS